ncbi:CvpA family protein [Dissulfurirhabdus thermomarina]|uniref:CvpA family protein n=1 Tax=Dissulfurirhabdus thermomarina TaxID=1765737 RepID=A0A6N9TRS4_DISTH|nr:CvpA family protein [Dissulfurirhabdus thermomarina]NDY42147.1 CvpA family protein [Dissulfurirhabdus thermomarina]NMX23081.1 CvpA family protein [Dissulfurirhabdus thermomarina]
MGGWFPDFTWVDYVIAAMVAVMLVRSLLKGFSRSIASVLGLVLGFVAAVSWGPALGKVLSPWVENPGWRTVLAFVFILVTAVLAATAAGVLARNTLESLKLGWLDRALGAALGLVKGILLAAVFFAALSLVLPGDYPAIRGSVLGPRIVRPLGLLKSLLFRDARPFKGLAPWRRGVTAAPPAARRAA